MENKETFEPKIIKVQELLTKSNLHIPEYQRPYKWTIKNVNQLIDDIIENRNKSAYRLGTIVFHKDENNVLNIVDGQQRTITLLLIALAIRKNEDVLKEKILKTKVNTVHSKWFDELKFSNPISLNNIQDNFLHINRRTSDFEAETVQFFFEKCELVEVVLKDISEAFQFFDSQNTRGKDLDPHDLLKAYHLREMMQISNEQERITTVKNWEDQKSENLKLVFAQYLFRIRNWAKGDSARIFSKEDIGLFKGINLGTNKTYPFSDLYRIGHFYTESYNQEIIRNIDRNKLDYPFQLDQVIINGKRFFEFVDHYMNKLNNIKNIESLSVNSKTIFEAINTYEGNYRSGDRYIRNLFDCILVYYFDKFGNTELDRAVEKFFVWAYSLRLNKKNVQFASVDNYALQSPHLFKTIKEALQPSEIFNLKFSVLTKVESTKTKKIEELFIKLNYLNG